MRTALEQLQEEVTLLKLDDSLLFLNRLLAASREDTPDPQLQPILRARKAGVPAFFVHFLTKQLLLHASNLGLYPLNGHRFLCLMDLYFKMDDPICTDPNWPTADPSGFFERTLGKQIPPQSRNLLQKFGLALGLFRDAGVVRAPNDSYDIRADIENALGVSVEQFMGMGLLGSALAKWTLLGQPCRGTFDHMYLVEAYRQGINLCVPEVLSQFLLRVACDRDAFRTMCDSNPLYRATDARYSPFEFNPLARFPVTDVGGGRFVTADPDLLIERSTFGLFYDLFERDGKHFSQRFGYVFDKFVGDLLGSVCPTNLLWWEADTTGLKPKNPGKVADWAFRGRTHTVLFECKSLRPSLELLTYGSDKKICELRQRVVEALTQLAKHSATIQAGRWAAYGFKPMPTIGVVVTYGQIQTVNGPFTRRRIAKDLASSQMKQIPHIVLSLEEFDSVIRLVELGHPLDEVIATLAAIEGSFNPLQRYAAELKDHAISTFTYKKGKAFLDSVATVEQPPQT